MKPINADTKTIVDYTDVGPGKKESGVCLLAEGKILLLPRLFAKAQLKQGYFRCVLCESFLSLWFLCKLLYEHSYEQRVRLVWFLIFMDLHLGRWVLALTTECGTGLPVLLSSLTWLQWGDRAPKLWSAGILRAPSSAFSKCPWYPWDPLGADVQSFTHLSNWDWLLQSCLPSNL